MSGVPHLAGCALVGKEVEMIWVIVVLAVLLVIYLAMKKKGGGCCGCGTKPEEKK